MFPPEDISELGVEKCLRILPHSNNTGENAPLLHSSIVGGFFVAAFRKVGEIPEDLELIPKINVATGKIRLRGLPYDVTELQIL